MFVNILLHMQGLGFPIVRTSNYCGTIISGEAPESDDGKLVNFLYSYLDGSLSNMQFFTYRLN